MFNSVNLSPLLASFTTTSTVPVNETETVTVNSGVELTGTATWANSFPSKDKVNPVPSVADPVTGMTVARGRANPWGKMTVSFKNKDTGITAMRSEVVGTESNRPSLERAMPPARPRILW